MTCSGPPGPSSNRRLKTGVARQSGSCTFRTTLKGLQMKFLPEDGAEFHGKIQHVGPREFLGSFWCQLDLRSRVEMEEPHHRNFESEEQARTWINGNAEARCFTKIRWHESS
jgi:hypothetical protein